MRESSSDSTIYFFISILYVDLRKDLLSVLLNFIFKFLLDWVNYRLEFFDDWLRWLEFRLELVLFCWDISSDCVDSSLFDLYYWISCRFGKKLLNLDSHLWFFFSMITHQKFIFNWNFGAHIILHRKTTLKIFIPLWSSGFNQWE